MTYLKKYHGCVVNDRLLIENKAEVGRAIRVS